MKKSVSERKFCVGAESSKQAGFTMLELMVSLTLFLIVMGAIWGLLAVTRADRSTTSQRVETIQTVRNAMNSVGRDALNTGYKYRSLGSFFPDDVLNSVFGIPADAGNNPDNMMSVLAGNDLNSNTLNGTVKTDQITFIYGDESFNGGQALSVPWRDCDGKQLVVSWPTPSPSASPSPTPTPSLPGNNDLVIISGDNSSAIGMVTSTVAGVPGSYSSSGGTAPCVAPPSTAGNTYNTIKFASTDLLSINKSGSNNVIQNVKANATLARVKIATYRILSDGTLVRTEYGNFTNGKQDMPLAYNVQDMQIKYVMKDGNIWDNPAAGPDMVLNTSDDTPTEMQNVRQVRIVIKARTAEKDLRTNQYSTVTITSTFNTRNLGYDAQ